MENQRVLQWKMSFTENFKEQAFPRIWGQLYVQTKDYTGENRKKSKTSVFPVSLSHPPPFYSKGKWQEGRKGRNSTVFLDCHLSIWDHMVTQAPSLTPASPSSNTALFEFLAMLFLSKYYWVLKKLQNPYSLLPLSEMQPDSLKLHFAHFLSLGICSNLVWNV